MRITITFWVVICTVLTFDICYVLSSDDTLRPVVKTRNGKVRGMRSFVTSQQTPVDKYFGIPYAQPPIGDRRFKRPIAPAPWTGTMDTVQFRSACYQIVKQTGFRGDDMWNPRMPPSEDCLYVNIWVPKNIQRAMLNLPTLVWIYGGGFISGSADLDVYDGSLLAATNNVIVVSMNYRVGPFGFLYLGDPDAPGNMGLMDQQLALVWVFQNIQNFGGDPRKITIAGESAGSASVSYHLLSPMSWDYFTSAIMESGTALSPWAFRTPNDSMIQSRAYLKSVNCGANKTEDILECLKKKSTESLRDEHNEHNMFSPTIDGEFLKKSPVELIREKRFKRCNIMLGFNTDEQTYFMGHLAPAKFGRDLPKPSLSSNELREYINRVTLSPHAPLSNSLQRDSALYVYVDSVPREIRGSNIDVLDDILGDNNFKCSVVQFAKAYADENLGVYLYQFDHRSPSTNPWPEWMGVMHGYEIEFIFGKPHNKSLGYSPADTRISDAMRSYWATFALEGNPNSVSNTFNEAFWPNFTSDQQKYKLLKAELLETKQFPRYKECSFWDEFLPTLQQHSEATALAAARCSACRNVVGLLALLLCLLIPVITTVWK